MGYQILGLVQGKCFTYILDTQIWIIMILLLIISADLSFYVLISEIRVPEGLFNNEADY